MLGKNHGAPLGSEPASLGIVYIKSLWRERANLTENGPVPGSALHPFAAGSFMQDFAPAHDLAQEPVAFLQPPAQILRRPREEVEREWRFDGQADLHRLADLVVDRHDDEQV